LNLVVHADSSVTLRAAERVRIKARFAGKGYSLVKKRNAGSHPLSGSRRAAAQASRAALQSFERTPAIPGGLRLARDAGAVAESDRTGRMDH